VERELAAAKAEVIAANVFLLSCCV
jgi:hypothetical protein